MEELYPICPHICGLTLFFWLCCHIGWQQAWYFKSDDAMHSGRLLCHGPCTCLRNGAQNALMISECAHGACMQTVHLGPFCTGSSASHPIPPAPHHAPPPPPPEPRSSQPCNVRLLQAVSAMLPSSKCIPDGFKAGMKHFSSTAYVQMALHGYSLRHSLETASQLLLRHRRRMHTCEGAAHAAVMPGKVGTSFLSWGVTPAWHWGGGRGVHFGLVGCRMHADMLFILRHIEHDMTQLDLTPRSLLEWCAMSCNHSISAAVLSHECCLPSIMSVSALRTGFGHA